MKGTLHKTEQGWVVEYAKHSELPLHPDDESLWMFAELKEGWKDKLEGKEVEFEIVDEFTHPELYTNVGWGDGIKYAKLILSKEQQKQLITEIMDLDAKDGLYEISDKEIEKAWISYKRECLEKFEKDTTIAGYAITNKEKFAKWYREQLKQRK